MPFEQRYIWGATAGMIKNMHKRLFPAMIRIVIENILLFLLPTIVYIAYIYLTRDEKPARSRECSTTRR